MPTEIIVVSSGNAFGAIALAQFPAGSFVPIPRVTDFVVVNGSAMTITAIMFNYSTGPANDTTTMELQVP